MTSGKPLVIVLAGTAATGKSTIAARIIRDFKDTLPNLKFIEGDDLHPPANIAKMSAGIPLQDEDRWEWLKDVAHKGSECAKANGDVSIVACSSLKKKYRDLIRQTEPETTFYFIFLYASKEEILNRLNQRKGHFMKANMMESQFKDLELPRYLKEPNCKVILLDDKDFPQIEDIVVETCNDLFT
ncbi:hypothetical protein KAFR_0E02860 [Kazachstania africana CBS 2517]|uniref:Gluconokinase n=1 Tax=Kazachstania africana (strain ATCC 22294 / BCRC 22015 / CBS 2517 / CECT 1963 / NBRC 1671 / NRRL Y-8276) TaxID=1071382 RepID=H2AVN8_KAZAF|nr:hypothetical protein KAFR_0E02860 [Kazachstania africana CBS 2517]CCF58438.1 hypothetical protein KAFR_0E02860 [Kazachstania africana CBS 2517]